MSTVFGQRSSQSDSAHRLPHGTLAGSGHRIHNADRVAKDALTSVLAPNDGHVVSDNVSAEGRGDAPHVGPHHLLTRDATELRLGVVVHKERVVQVICDTVDTESTTVAFLVGIGRSIAGGYSSAWRGCSKSNRLAGGE